MSQKFDEECYVMPIKHGIIIKQRAIGDNDDSWIEGIFDPFLLEKKCNAPNLKYNGCLVFVPG